MGHVVVSIHQPNLMPWIGYFKKIYLSDVFVYLDDAQFQKTGSNYTNRTSININGESKYLTVPIIRNSGTTNINCCFFSKDNWRKKFVGTIQANYAKAPFFNDFKDIIFDLINFETNLISEFNMNFITNMINLLKFHCSIYKSSDLNLTTHSTERLIEIIKFFKGNVYLSGKGGDNYQEKDLFLEENIELSYSLLNPNFSYPQYKTSQFLSGLSIIDAIFNIGIDSMKESFKNNLI